MPLASADSEASPSRDRPPSHAVVLLSGGLDSAVSLACALRDGHVCQAISFDYGQRHRYELLAARRVARSMGLTDRQHVTIAIDLRAIGGSALTDAAIHVPKDRPVGPAHAGGSSIPVTYVPARNLIFLSCAAALAETVSPDRSCAIYLGVNSVDYSGYPDCREPFLRAFQHAASLGTKAGDQGWGVRVVSPLVHLSKAQIIRLGAELGVDFSLTHSCYDPVVFSSGVPRGAALANAGIAQPAPDDADVRACGHCDSCLIRAAGFRDAGVPDPTRYA